MGTIKGIGRIYQQNAIDTHSNVGVTKAYREKTALTAGDLLNDMVLPPHSVVIFQPCSHFLASSRNICTVSLV